MPSGAAVHREFDEGMAVELLRGWRFEQPGPVPDVVGQSAAVSSCRASSERRASTAARAGSACRNTSLNTSSDSGPL